MAPHKRMPCSCRTSGGAIQSERKKMNTTIMFFWLRYLLSARSRGGVVVDILRSGSESVVLDLDESVSEKNHQLGSPA